MKSVMVHQFSQVPQANVPRSSFSRPSTYKTTFDAGWLIPFFVDEALPGDTFKLHVKLFARLATPIVPIMDNLYLDWFFFAVPNRLVWSHWKQFCGERDEPSQVYEGLVPQIQPSNSGGFAVGSLADYFGLPVNISNITCSCLWHRAYNLIYNEWFRSENLINRAHQYTGDNDEGDSVYPLRRRGKRFDYFTACNPWPLKGPESTIGIGSTAPVIISPDRANNATGVRFADSGGAIHSAVFGMTPSTSAINEHSLHLHEVSTAGNISLTSTLPTSVVHAVKDNAIQITPSNFITDLSQASAVSINDFRRAVALQHWYERLAQGGSRYTEVVRSVFGVVSPDARLQRPEYLGGGTSRVNVSAVPQTSATESADTGTPQGNLAAFASVADEGWVLKSFTEHSVIIGLLSVRADLTYQQGIDRMFSRRTLEEFYWPQFAHIGEQAVLNKEIFAQGNDDDDGVFGYQERYAEYRYKPSKITGKLRSGITGSLDVWHLSQYYDSLPSLNETFINDNPPVDRVIAVPSEPQFILDSFIDCQAIRPMPVYGTPGLMRL